MDRFLKGIFFDFDSFDEEVFLDKLSFYFEVGGVYIIDVLVPNDYLGGVYSVYDRSRSTKLKRIVVVLESQNDKDEQLMNLFEQIYLSVSYHDFGGSFDSIYDGLVIKSFYISIEKFI